MQKNIKQQALQFFNTGKLKKAHALYEKCLKQNQKDPEVLYMLGAIYGQAGNYTRASDYFSKTLELQPGAFVALCGLAAAEKQLGNYEKAIKTFENALKFQPHNTDILLEVAGLLLQQSKLEEAETLLHEILKTEPECAEAHHGLGEIYLAKRKVDTAILYYRQALNYDNKRANTHNKLGLALGSKGLYTEAINHLKSAVTIKPDFAGAHKNLGKNHLTIGEFNEALHALNKAIKIKPDYIDAIACLASVYEKMGKPDQAYNIIKPWLDKPKKHPEIGQVLLPICKKTGTCDEAISYVNNLFEQGISDSAKESLHYEMGMLLDKLEKYDDAFFHFKAANELRPDNFRPAEYTAYMDAFKRVFSWQFMQNAPKASYQTETPIFIVGMPRSGTSLVEQILDSHADVSGAGELTEIEVYAIEISRKTNTNTGFPLALSGITTELLDVYAKQFEQRLRTINSNSKYITDKMPQNYIYLGLISLMFPKARIIHCVRNPLDTCLSIYMQAFSESHDYATNLKNIANYYLEYKRLMDHWKSIPNMLIHDIQYEQLVLDPENSVRKLLEFLEVDWDPKCLAFYESKRHVPTASYDQVRNKLYTSSIHRWKHYEDNLGTLIDTLSPHIPDLLE